MDLKSSSSTDSLASLETLSKDLQPEENLHASKLECDVLSRESETIANQFANFAHRMLNLAKESDILHKEFLILSEKYSILQQKKESLTKKLNDGNTEFVTGQHRLCFSFPGERKLASFVEKKMSPKFVPAIPPLSRMSSLVLADIPENAFSVRTSDGINIFIKFEEIKNITFHQLHDLIIDKLKSTDPTSETRGYCGLAMIMNSELYENKINDETLLPNIFVETLQKCRKINLIFHKSCTNCRFKV
jgi:hypothetical protein